MVADKPILSELIQFFKKRKKANPRLIKSSSHHEGSEFNISVLGKYLAIALLKNIKIALLDARILPRQLHIAGGGWGVVMVHTWCP